MGVLADITARHMSLYNGIDGDMTSPQGLTLVHFSAQPKDLLWHTLGTSSQSNESTKFGRDGLPLSYGQFEQSASADP